MRKKHGFPGGSMQKDGKFQPGVHGKFDINLGGKLKKKSISSTGVYNLFYGKAHF